MIIRLLIRAALLAGLVSVPGLAAESNTGPQARFETKSVDFGQVMPTELRRHDFVVTNAGDAPLIIEQVSPSCGCTTAGEWDREIAPGKSGKIPVAFNPSNFNGAVTKAVTVTTNDRGNPNHVLEIKAVVWRPFSVQPAFANFLPVDGEPMKETKVIRIVNNASEPATLRPPQASDERFVTELKTIQPGKEFELHVSYDSARGSGSPSASITIGTSNKDQPVLTVTAFAMPQPAIVVIPATLQLPPQINGQHYNHNIVIRNNGSAALEVSDAKANAAGITVKLTEAQRGKTFYVSVVIPKDFQPPPAGSVEISVRTSHPKFPVIRVPIVPAQAAMEPAASTTGIARR